MFPGSGLAKKPPRALMTAELVETSRLFARMNAAIDPAWAEPIAGDLVKRTYGEPRWEQRQGAAVADERVTLFGVPIVEKRRIQYARLNPAHARDLFLEHALLAGEWQREVGRDPLYEFDRANRRLRTELDEDAERTRSRPVDEQAILDFYDDRVPADVTDVRRFETWWRDDAGGGARPPHDAPRGPARRGGRSRRSTSATSRRPGSRATSASGSPTGSRPAPPTTG